MIRIDFSPAKLVADLGRYVNNSDKITSNYGRSCSARTSSTQDHRCAAGHDSR